MADEEQKHYVFRHKTIRRFSSAGFEFKNFELHLYSDEDRERFVEVYNELPPRDKNQIVEVDLEAKAASEREVSAAPIVRGAMTAGDIITQKDGQRIVSGDAQAAANALAANPGKPAGFTLPNLGK